MTVRWAAATDVGRARERNEDAYYGGRRLFAVADGLGGHKAGEVASKMAVEAIAALDGDPGADVAAALPETIREANRAVYAHALRDPSTRGMGTTLTALAIDGDVARLAHVGDSRCYLIRDGEITMLSRDHTLVAQMIEEGSITPAQAEVHPQRSVLTRALGAEPAVDVDTLDVPLHAGDRLLLCSDGLTSAVVEDDLDRLASDPDPTEACRMLVDEANARGGPDNITVVIVDVLDGAPAPAEAAPAREPAAELRRRRFAALRLRLRRRPPARAVVWATAVAVVLAASYTGLRIWSDRSWYVGVDGSRIAIYRGLPTDFVVSLHRIHEQTGLTVDDVAPYFRDRLADGIRARSLSDARRIVAEQIPRAVPDIAVPPTPTPSVTGSPR